MSNRAQPRAGMAPPLPREWLDSIATPIRVLFGLIFISWSWVSTVIIVGAWLKPLMPESSIPGLPNRLLVALGLGLLVSLAEFVASDRWNGAYWLVLLILDAPFTIWQTRVWLLIMVQAQIEPSAEISTLGHVAIWLTSIAGGIIAAKFGEVLLFGHHKR